MAAPKGKGGKGGEVSASAKVHQSVMKKTSIGHSANTRYNSKNDKRTKKVYRGQG